MQLCRSFLATSSPSPTPLEKRFVADTSPPKYELTGIVFRPLTSSRRRPRLDPINVANQCTSKMRNAHPKSTVLLRVQIETTSTKRLYGR